MKQIIKKVFISLISSTLLFACTEDYFEFEKVKTNKWKPELALPLVNSSLSLEELLINEDQNGIIKEDPQTKILEIVYDGRVFSPIGEAQIPLPNQVFNRSISSPTPLPSNGGQTPPLNYNDSIPFNSSVEIDTLILKNGHLTL